MRDQEIAQRIGKVVRFHRKKARLTQLELAKFAEVGKTVVFDVEKGKSTVKLLTLLRILHVLNLRIQLAGPIMHLLEKEMDEKSESVR